MPAARTKSATRPYHHGNLRQAMIDAAVEIVAEHGAEAVTIREAARRAGVSSGAPFRHFSNKTELMTAVAEDGMARLRASVERALAACVSTHPLLRLMAIGDGYLTWAFAHPTHYRVVGDRTQIDFWGSANLTRDNGWIRAEMTALFARAKAEGLLRHGELGAIHLQSRALAYGLARMHVDGHLKEFGIVKSKAPAALREVLHDWLRTLARDPESLR